MTRKRCYLITVAILATCVCITLGVLAMLPRPCVTKEHFDRIEKGMTKAEVEEILGHAFHEGVSFGAGGEMLWLQGDDDSVAEIILMDDCVSEKRWHASVGTLSE